MTSILYDGLKRPFASVRKQSGRNKHINKALVSGIKQTELDDVAKVAFDDVKLVLGNYHDSYSAKVESFLKEVERSTIPDALKQLSICGQNHEKIFPAFEAIYNTYENLPFDSIQLFNAIFSAIDINLKQSVNDPVVFDAMKVHLGEVLGKIDQLTNCLQNINSTPDLKFDQFSKLRLKIAKLFEADNRNLNVETTQGAKKVNITKLVIPPRLAAVFDISDIPMPHRDAQSDQRDTISFLVFRRTFRNAVIMGDPGGGKTTLTQYLCHTLARQISLGTDNPNYHELDTRDFQIPLKVVLRTYVNRTNLNPSYTIFDYLIDEVKPACDNDTKLATSFLIQALHLGNATIIFDGLDEILDVGPRREVVEKLEQFSAVYASCATLITSRIVGYKDAPLSEDYQVFTLSRFNEEEVRRFSEKLIGTVGQLKPKEAKGRAADFLSQTESSASDLRVNPLLLGLMVYIFNARGDVPNNRPEIYKECSLLMFEKWDQRRDINFKLPRDFDLLDLFGFLAAKIFGNTDEEEGVNTAWLSKNLREFFVLWYEDKARSVEASNVLVEFITGRAWVMCEIGPGMYKFTHRTFLEYFFARRLEEEAGGVSQLVGEKLKMHIEKAEWDVVGHLSLQISTFRSGPKSALALDALTEILSVKGSSPEVLINSSVFIAKATEYLTLPESKLRFIIDQIFQILLNLDKSYSSDVNEVIHIFLSANSFRSEYVKSIICELAIQYLATGSSNQRSMVLCLLSKRFSGLGYSKNQRVQQLSSSVWEAFETVRVDYKSELFQNAKSDLVEAKHFISIYRENYLELYIIHGFDLLFDRVGNNVTDQHVSTGYLLLLDLYLRNSSEKKMLSQSTKINSNEAIELLDLISNKLLEVYKLGSIFEFLDGYEPFSDLVYIAQDYKELNIQNLPKRSTKKAIENAGKVAFLLCLFHCASNGDAKLGHVKVKPPGRKRVVAEVTRNMLRDFHSSSDVWDISHDVPWFSICIELLNASFNFKEFDISVPHMA